MKVAIVVDWLAVMGGAERVLKELLALYPHAHVFALVDFLDDRQFLNNHRITTSALQNLPFARQWFRAAIGLMPILVEQWRFRDYDLVLSSSHAVAKGIIVGPDQAHVSYVHTPMRYAWDLQDEYLTGQKGDWVRRWLLHRLRLWDQLSATRPDMLVANSHFVARRIARHWGREAEVVHPPVDIERFRRADAGTTAENFYLTVSRLVPYKRIDLLLDAFATMPNRRLVVIGDGPEMKSLRRRASSNVSLLGQQPDHVVDAYMAQCQAYLLAAEEDFGIAPLEAQACGKPVIALARGAAPETLGASQARSSAMFFDNPNPQAIQRAIESFESSGNRIDPAACRANAERFAPVFFRQRISAVIERTLASKAGQRAAGIHRQPDWNGMHG